MFARADPVIFRGVAFALAVGVAGSRQGVVEFRRYLDARVNIIEQHANLFGRKGSTASANRLALKANSSAQAGQVVRDPVVGLSEPDHPVFDQN